MNQRPPCLTQALSLVASGLLAALLSVAAEADAATKSAPKAAPVPACESPFTRQRPAAKQLNKVLQSHARWLEDRDSADGRRANLCRTDLLPPSIGGSESRANHPVAIMWLGPARA